MMFIENVVEYVMWVDGEFVLGCFEKIATPNGRVVVAPTPITTRNMTPKTADAVKAALAKTEIRKTTL